MKITSVQPRIIPFEQPERRSTSNLLRQVFIQPFERLGVEKSFILISHSFMTFFLGCLAGSNR